MMKDALIQLGLTEEQAEKVMGLHTEAAQNLVPKEKLEEAVTEKTQLETSIQERDRQLEGLKAAAGASEELKQKLDAAITKNKEDSEKAAADRATDRKENAVNLYLLKEGAKNIKTVKALLDLEKVSLDGENLIGLQEQVEAAKATDAYLFEPAISGREPYGGDKTLPSEEYKNNPFKRESFNLTKQGQLMRENPELARKLKAAAGYKI